MSEDDKSQDAGSSESTPPPEPPEPEAEAQPRGETPPPPGPPPAGPAVTMESELRDERMWAMFCHLSAIVGFVVPFGNIIAPLIIWLIKKDQYAYVDANGKEALNFQISVTIYLIAAGVIGLITCGVGVILVPLVAIAALVFVIIAAIKTNQGEAFRYPVTIRFIK